MRQSAQRCCASWRRSASRPRSRRSRLRRPRRRPRKGSSSWRLQQARYEAAHARRQYDAVDPANRLVAGELERRWNEALRP